MAADSKAYNGDVQIIDSSSIRVHQHAANGKKATRSHYVGRSHGGLTTKIRALADACGLPILLKLTQGQARDGNVAYDSNALHETLAARGARANVKPMPNRLKPHRFNRRLYRRCNLVERFFNKLKYFRAAATRYNKRSDNYIASVKLAAARI